VYVPSCLTVVEVNFLIEKKKMGWPARNRSKICDHLQSGISPVSRCSRSNGTAAFCNQRFCCHVDSNHRRAFPVENTLANGNKRQRLLIINTL